MKIHRIALAFFLVMFCAALFAQNQPQQQPQGRPILPPPYEVLSGHRVTFRFTAPQAASMELNGDWPGGLGGLPMAKDDKGVWPVTIGPLQHYAIAGDCIFYVLPRFHQDRCNLCTCVVKVPRYGSATSGKSYSVARSGARR